MCLVVCRSRVYGRLLGFGNWKSEDNDYGLLLFPGTKTAFNPDRAFAIRTKLEKHIMAVGTFDSLKRFLLQAIGIIQSVTPVC
jgi:hypothetical protein